MANDGRLCVRCGEGRAPYNASGICLPCQNKIKQLQYDDDNEHPQPTKRRGGPP